MDRIMPTTSGSGSGSGSISGSGSVSRPASTVDSMQGIHVHGSLEAAPFGRSTTGHQDDWTSVIWGCGGGGGGADCDNSHICCCSNWCWGWWQYSCWGGSQYRPSWWWSGCDQSASMPLCTNRTGSIYTTRITYTRKKKKIYITSSHGHYCCDKEYNFF